MIEQFFTGSSICNANNAQCSVRLENLDSWKQPYITVKGEYLNALKEYLKQKYPKYTIVSDIGSGINFKRKGFQTILDKIFEGNVSEVVVLD